MVPEIECAPETTLETTDRLGASSPASAVAPGRFIEQSKGVLVLEIMLTAGADINFHW